MLDYIKLTKDEYAKLIELSPMAMRLYTFYKFVGDKESGKSWYSLRSIERETGMSRKTAIKAITELEGSGLLVANRKFRKSTTVKISGVNNPPTGGKSTPIWGKKVTPKYNKQEVLAKEVMEAAYGFYSPDMVI